MAKKRKNANRLVDILVDYLEDAKRSGIDDVPVATGKGGVRWALNAVTATDKSDAALAQTRSVTAQTQAATALTRATAAQSQAATAQTRASAAQTQAADVCNEMASPNFARPATRSMSASSSSSLPLASGDTMARTNKAIVQDIPVYDEVETILRDMNNQDKKTILSRLAQEVSRCNRCPELVKNRTQTVFGTGNPNASLMFIGEGPGADEDEQGVPFVGRCGQLLTNIITGGMKLTREDVYICNVVRCRPPGNRTPFDSEGICCRPFLDATIKVVAPQYICCLGAVAAHILLATTEAIGLLRGKVYDYHGIKVVCTYHPAYLLRCPPAKAQTWEDIKLLMREMKLL